MIRAFTFMVAVLMAWQSASAGRRCGRTYQTLQTRYGWSTSCRECHKPKQAEAYNWRKAITTIEAQKVETAAFISALQTISPQPQGQASAYGVPMGYASTLQGELSTFAPQGNTLYGASQVYGRTPPWDRMVLMNQRGKLTEQLQAFAHQDSQDLSDLNAEAHRQASAERELEITQSNIIESQRIRASVNSPAVNQTFRFSATTGPTGQTIIVPEQQQTPPYTPQAMQGPDVLQLLTQRCASCHAGANVSGKFNLDAGLASLSPEQKDDIAQRVALPVDDPAHMPKAATGEGHGPGPMLDRREINAIEDWAWSGGPY
jgi:mono/diheme cytochrome c family protein